MTTATHLTGTQRVGQLEIITQPETHPGKFLARTTHELIPHISDCDIHIRTLTRALSQDFHRCQKISMKQQHVRRPAAANVRPWNMPIGRPHALQRLFFTQQIPQTSHQPQLLHYIIRHRCQDSRHIRKHQIQAMHIPGPNFQTRWNGRRVAIPISKRQINSARKILLTQRRQHQHFERFSIHETVSSSTSCPSGRQLTDTTPTGRSTDANIL